jgi:hypothetical protein
MQHWFLCGVLAPNQCPMQRLLNFFRHAASADPVFSFYTIALMLQRIYK